jgi:hypothetical protein
MPEQKTMKRANRAKREGKAPSTQAGEFVREEMDHIREGKHGARSTKQAIAIGLSKARRAGIKLKAPKAGSVPEETRRKAKRDSENGESNGKPNQKRSRATTRALKREGTAAASTKALSRQGHSAAGRQTKSERSTAAKKGARTRARGR